jgi:diguanylate cyclase (GGDEF)-like protein/PAS domain S-box-containing protein
MGDGMIDAPPPVSESLLALALGAVSEGTVITDAACRTIYTNAAFTAITGYPREEALGRDCTFLQGPETSREEAALLRAAISTGRRYEGTILNYRKDGSRFWNHLVVTPLSNASGQVTNFVGVQRDVTDIVDEREKLSYEATHDQLTGLPNREALRRHLRTEFAEATADGSVVAVGLIDLDGFKGVNDASGHGAGDEVLRAVAGRIRRSIRPADHAARIGGDEFIVVITMPPTGMELSGTAERLIRRLGEPVRHGDEHLAVGASAGVALGVAGDHVEVLTRADDASYAAKRRGGNQVAESVHAA